MSLIKIKITKKQATELMYQDALHLLPFLMNIIETKKEISYFLVSKLEKSNRDMYSAINSLWLPFSMGFILITWKGLK